MKSTDQKLIEIAIELVKYIDKQADALLPQKIVDVVKLHSKLAVGSAWIPIPGADMAAGAASIWGMYIRINNKINMPVKENIIKTIGSGVATNLASYTVASGVGSALKLIPGIGTVGGAVFMSATLYAVTLASGYVYLKALCLLAKRDGPNMDMSKLSDSVKEVLKEKSIIKEFINNAKQTYKK
ncbi:hypothetical protein [Prevotella koreensis]